jgi:cell wall-associated NlpC family hydrolase
MVKFLSIFMMTVLLSSAPSWAEDASTTNTPALNAQVPSTSTSTSTDHPSHTELALFAMGLIGAVYKPGGDNPERGMDCSGFVRYVFHEVAGLKLPHSALALSKINEVISKADLKPGDLVFFKTTRRVFSHVGIYLGGNQFVHASSSETGKVMVSNLDDTYWLKHYEGARRVLTASNKPLSQSSVVSDPIASFAQ